MDIKLIIVGIVCAVVGAVLVELWIKRGKTPRPLAERMKAGMPESAETEKPLGMEATDLESVERAQKLSEISALKSVKVKFK